MLRSARRVGAGIVLLAGMSGAWGQDLGNGVGLVDAAVTNVDGALHGLIAADASGVIVESSGLGAALVANLSDGTPAESSTRLIADTVMQSGSLIADSGGLQLNSGAGLVASLLQPVTSLYFPSSLLASGLPFVQGERIVPLEQAIGITQGLPLERIDALFQVDLLGPGDSDGGGVLVPVFSDERIESLPLFGATGGGFEILGRFAGGGTGAILPGELIAMLISQGGGLGAGGSTLANANGGLSASEIGLPLEAIDLDALAALLGGATLQGLE